MMKRASSVRSLPASIVAVVFTVVAMDTALGQTRAFRILNTPNMLFEEGLVFEQPVRSLIECATCCSVHITCVTFTRVMGSTSGAESCRGHASLMTRSSSRRPTESGDMAETYRMINAAEKRGECVLSPCQNGGSCIDQDNAYTCNCEVGYTGRQCEEDINECRLYSPCPEDSCCQNTIGSYSCSPESESSVCD